LASISEPGGDSLSSSSRIYFTLTSVILLVSFPPCRQIVLKRQLQSKPEVLFFLGRIDIATVDDTFEFTILAVWWRQVGDNEDGMDDAGGCRSGIVEGGRMCLVE
jgi:hypothetical protein